jgi:hypothetical protein
MSPVYTEESKQDAHLIVVARRISVSWAVIVQPSFVFRTSDWSFG